MSVFETTALAFAGVGPGDGAAQPVELRANVFEMTQVAEDAVLRPRETGAWPRDLRAALAARIARLNGEKDLAARHDLAAGDYAALGDPTTDGRDLGQGAVIAFVDKVTAQTRDVEASDIVALQAAGVADADIVRLAELTAFLAYQLRVIAGLRLMAGRR